VRQDSIFRVIDVNYNRSKEGLRVVEDILRFVVEDDALRRKVRLIRHDLNKVMENEFSGKLLKARNSVKDLGRKTDELEMSRSNLAQLFYANIQRSKESLRVLEEFFKIVNKNKVALLKKNRYRVYELEKNAFKKWPALRNFR
jgi:thiamine-phosphate pyrophosphorylase